MAGSLRTEEGAEVVRNDAGADGTAGSGKPAGK
jgi:hypothetical protein